MIKGASLAGEVPRLGKPDVSPAVREASNVMEAAHEERRMLATDIERDHVTDTEAEKNRTKSDEARSNALEALHRGYPV